MLRRQGNYTRIDPHNPKAIGYCDITGFPCRHEDLVKQMEYSANGLIWTGLLVHPKFADKPNPQGLTPPVKADPYPIKNPRPDTTTGA
jgi:hypothetical protein